MHIYTYTYIYTYVCMCIYIYICLVYLCVIYRYMCYVYGHNYMYCCLCIAIASLYVICAILQYEELTRLARDEAGSISPHRIAIKLYTTTYYTIINITYYDITIEPYNVVSYCSMEISKLLP